ncbi:glycosyltransferase family 4 protein [Ornithinibacillus salinisoli]|uniref:Glycosyltransferase family 4 protein n=1 Tax=Ornithinibacillus salinisoli TaxID=1848459 RepID=A0ABW4VYN1_9BACI
MKIAIFTDTFVPDVNGVARTLKRFTDYLEKHAIEYRVFAPKSTNEDLFTSHVLRFASLPFFLYPECRIAFPNIIHVREEIQEFQPDIIHVATPFNMGLCGLHYAKKFDIPVVGSYHTDFDRYLDYYDFSSLKKILWKYMRWFHRPLHKIFVPSIATFDHLQKHGFMNLAIWPRGVDCSHFHPKFDPEVIRKKYHINERYILLYVGRLALEKDVLVLPQIAELLPESVRKDVHWLIVGDGPQKKELEMASPNNLTLAGFLSGTDLAHVYAAADLFVFPSVTETFGNVVLESLASATPVIGANAGGVRTIIENNVTGMLCEGGDATEFARTIANLLNDKEKRDEMGVQGRRYAITQSWNAIFSDLLLEYEAVLKRNILEGMA